ncbi:hypothetical protein C8R46DRAFT_258388 [Mycena filopes]|nr:hypothetical protein C8R46DRAFT_258388 [Mycena filopes]
MQCQTLDWQGRMVREGRPHKEWCAVFKRTTLLMPAAQSIIKSFPWGRLEDDGTFFDDLATAKFKVLGGAGFGFWSQTGLGLHEDDDEDDPALAAHRTRFPDSEWVQDHEEMRDAQKRIGFVNGQDLLKKKHLADDAGWKLPTSLVLRRDFSLTQPPRRLDSLLESWDEWYAWRGLSKASPVALLMHYPLTVYRMLTHTLGITAAGPSKSSKRVSLTVHYIGAEIELNFIPLFSELALLLPNYDINLVFFGPCVYNIGKTALKSKHRASLLTRAMQDDTPVFTYDAPAASGAGRLCVFLHTATKLWAPPSYGLKPDALVACNAGLFVYPGADALVRASMRQGIPFAVSDYQQYMLESNSAVVAHMQGHRAPPKEVVMNPFQRPGQRHYTKSNLAPSMENGFLLVVCEGKPAARGAGVAAAASGSGLGRGVYVSAFVLVAGLVFFNYVLPP